MEKNTFNIVAAKSNEQLYGHCFNLGEIEIIRLPHPDVSKIYKITSKVSFKLHMNPMFDNGCIWHHMTFDKECPFHRVKGTNEWQSCTCNMHFPVYVAEISFGDGVKKLMIDPKQNDEIEEFIRTHTDDSIVYNIIKRPIKEITLVWNRK